MNDSTVAEPLAEVRVETAAEKKAALRAHAETADVAPAGWDIDNDALAHALSWLSHHHGRPRSAESLLAGQPSSGRLSPAGALRVLREAGFNAGLVQREIGDISALLLPAVLLLSGGDACIVVARQRLIFAPRVAPPEYLARFQCADLMLDTFPFNAGTTASDALWMGLPIVTRAGRTYISRMAGSLLGAVGLPDLVTEDLAAYERLAITLGQQPQRTCSYKRYLAEHGRASPLFDLPQIVRDIEVHFERLALAARLPAPATAPGAAPN